MTFSRPSSPSGKIRRGAVLFCCFYLFLLLLPAAVYAVAPPEGKGPGAASALSPAASAGEEKESAPAGFLESRLSAPQTASGEEHFLLHDAATGKTFEISEENFLPAALACEMDLSSPEEALKAQAVAIATLYGRQREAIPCDSAAWQVWTTEEQMRERWGEEFEETYRLAETIAREVKGQRLRRDGKLIEAEFFAISAGNTETGTASPGDLFADGFLSEAVFTPEGFSAAAGEISLSGPVENWLTDLEYSPAGYVQTARLGGQTMTGAQLRALFSLRSAAFTVRCSPREIRFTVRGWGHGRGMSQAGAVFFAKRGMGYREILAHYYPGAAVF